MRNSRCLWLGLATLGLAIAALIAMGSGAQAACFGTYVYSTQTYDTDYDGLDDSVQLVGSNPPYTGGGFYTYTVNASLEDSWGYQADFESQLVYSADNTLWGPTGLILTVPASFYPAEYYVVVSSDEYPGPPCQWDTLAAPVYPLGDYALTIEGGPLNQTGDRNTTVTYRLTITASSHNPDILTFSPNNLDGWQVDYSPLTVSLNETESALVNVTVHIPPGAPPLRNSTTEFLSYSRDGVSHAAITLHTAVSGQVFGAALSSANASKDGPPGATVTFVVRALNTGDYHDTFNLAATTPPAGWTVDLSAPTIGLDAGAAGTFNVTVHLPIALTGTLVWAFNITATAGDASTQALLQLRASLALPDFAVLPTDISLDASAPNAGDTVVVHVTVRNVGTPMALEIVVRLFDGRSNLSATVSSGLSGSAQATFAWRAFSGTVQLHAILDAAGSIPEADETNNDAFVTILVNALPTASLSITAASVRTGQSVSLSAAGSTDGDGAVTACYFDFGDGQNSGWNVVLTASHAYAAAGTYAIKVRVRDNAGAESENATAALVVTANVPPTAAVANSAASVQTGQAITISAAGSLDTDGSVAAFYFEFGDGTNSDWVTTPSVTHTYTSGGTYTLKVRVRDDTGAESATATSTVTVSASAAPAEGGSLLPLLAIVVVVASAGVAVAFVLRRKGRTPPSPPDPPPA